MKFIQKKYTNQNPAEPLKMTAWKQQEAATLEVYYKANNAEAAWGHLFENKPNREDPDLVYYTKNELTNDLLEEQGFICAYCNRLIRNQQAIPDDFPTNDTKEFLDRKCSVEHVRAKSVDVRNNTFDYQNLVATCRGGEKLPPPREKHCDHERGNKHLPLHPLMPECEQELIYDLYGNVNGTTPRAIEIIKTLGLDIAKLREDRESKIKGFVMNRDEDGNELQIGQEEAQKLFVKLSQKQENQFTEYCGPILSVLKRLFSTHDT